MTHATPEFMASLRDATIYAPEFACESVEISHRLRELETALVAPGKAWEDVRLADYKYGSAKKPDDVWMQDVPGSKVVASAEHATNMYKRSESKYIRADHGTGALVMLLAEQGVASGVAPRGRQTWNAAVSDDSYRVKRVIRRLLPSRDEFLSVHGMYSGRVRHLADSSEVHAVIGLGAAPNELSWEAARKVVAAGKDLGLTVSIANEEALFKYDEVTGKLAISEETGEPVKTALRGSKPAMTNALAYRIMEETGDQKVSMQIEMAAMLRLRALDDDRGWHSSERSRTIGTYLGYMLVKAAAEVVGTPE